MTAHYEAMEVALVLWWPVNLALALLGVFR
jgi:hypothetical protein